MAPIAGPAQPEPLPPPWSLTVAELGLLLTDSQKQTVLARLRVKGYPVTEWHYPQEVAQ